VYGWFRATVWPEHWLRYPAKHFAAVAVLGSALAAIGLDAALRQARAKHVWVTVLVSLGVAVALVIGVDAGVAVSSVVNDAPTLRPPLETAKVEHAILAGGWSTVAALTGFGAAVFVATRERVARWAAPVAAAVLVGQIGAHTFGLIPVVPRDAITGDGILAALPRPQDTDAPRPRFYREPGLWNVTRDPREMMLALARTAADDLGWLHGFAHVPGYTPAATTTRWKGVLAAAIGAHAVRRTLNLFGVDYAAMSDSSRREGFDLVEHDAADGLVILRNQRARARAFVTPRWTVLGSDDAVLEAMMKPSAELDAVRFAAGEPAALREGEGEGEGEGGAGAATPCEVHVPRPERVELGCTSPEGGYAVLLDEWAPGWSATVDGAPESIERADGVLRAVRVGPGSHRVEFTFRAPGLRAGAWLSFAAWLLVGCAAGGLGFRVRRPPAASGPMG
jgi:hypothetical protein